ncbi:hypothetical protein BGX23_000342 [Mortierella sp. AD031]|nr:hypothetical protein BGX23_000342 [Mortierella sp. AD031]
MPVVTPLIDLLARSRSHTSQSLFRDLDVKTRHRDEGFEAAKRMYKQREPPNYKEETILAQWVGPSLGTDDDGRTFYKEAMVDSELLKVGDCVFIRKDDDDDEDDEMETKDEDGSQCEVEEDSDMVLEDEDGETWSLESDHIDNDEDEMQDAASYKGGDEDEADSSETSDMDDTPTDIEMESEPVANKTWFAQIMFFFERDNEMMVHLRWFSQANETLLMEQGSWQELYLLDNCDDADLYSVMGKCAVRRVCSRTELSRKDTYFCRLWYDPAFCAYEDVIRHEGKELEDSSESQGLRRCVCCTYKQLKTQELAAHKTRYHVGDFVYIADRNDTTGSRSSNEPTPFKIGQIVNCDSIQEQKVAIRILIRHNDFLDYNPSIEGMSNRIQQNIFKDCRRLVLTDERRTVALDDLEAVCRVRFVPEKVDYDTETIEDLNTYKDGPDRYWYKDYLLVTPLEASAVDLWEGPLPADLWENLRRIQDDNVVVTSDKTTIPVELPTPCQVCETGWKEDEGRMKGFLKDKAKLRAMDLFAGCGGLSLGLKRSGVIDTRYAVEQDKSAASTFQRNFPATKVFVQDASKLLRQAIAEHCQQRSARPRTTQASPPPTTTTPAPGDVDFLYCGPPWQATLPMQGFTHANTSRNGNDPRNSLIATALSFVDVYRPQYFLLENVRGLLDIKWEKDRMVLVKYIVRCLTELGYQCRIGMLQAGSHGVPQSRYRFFVWAAQLGHALPTFPLPTTAFKSNNSEGFIPPLNLDYNHATFDYRGRRGLQAPDPMVSIRDAVSDLPGFEYYHPDEIDPLTQRPKRSRNTRNSRRPAFVQVNPQDRVGFEDFYLQDKNQLAQLNRKDKARVDAMTRYISRPQSEFQRKMRSGVADKSTPRIHNHTTERIKEETLKRIFELKMVPGARYKGKKARLDFDGHFWTIRDGAFFYNISNITHPNQHRLLSARERARAQGFPDHFVFLSAKGQGARPWRRQLGNAVPPPLAAALGNKLVEAMLEDESA